MIATLQDTQLSLAIVHVTMHIILVDNLSGRHHLGLGSCTTWLVFSAGYVELESDSLNEHECMASFTSLLQHMLRHDITPSAADEVCAVWALPVYIL